MEQQSSKRMVKCLYRIIQHVQLCFPQSDIERFDILHERLLKRSLTQERGLTHLLWATEEILMQIRVSSLMVLSCFVSPDSCVFLSSISLPTIISSYGCFAFYVSPLSFLADTSVLALFFSQQSEEMFSCVSCALHASVLPFFFNFC